MNKGVTTIDLLLAVVIASIVGGSIAILFPKSFKSMASNRQRIVATGLATSKMDEIKSLPYPLIPRTVTGNYFSDVTNNGCDCKPVVWSLLPLAATRYNNGNNVGDPVTSDGIAFTRQVCINLVERPGATWDPHCPAIEDDDATISNIRGKNIRVHVTWSVNNETKSIDL